MCGDLLESAGGPSIHFVTGGSDDRAALLALDARVEALARDLSDAETRLVAAVADTAEKGALGGLVEELRSELRRAIEARDRAGTTPTRWWVGKALHWGKWAVALMTMGVGGTMLLEFFQGRHDRRWLLTSGTRGTARVLELSECDPPRGEDRWVILRLEVTPDRQGHWRSAPARFERVIKVQVDSPDDPAVQPGASFRVRFDPADDRRILVALRPSTPPVDGEWIEPDIGRLT